MESLSDDADAARREPVSRRSFLKQMGATGLAVTLPELGSARAEAAISSPPSGTQSIQLRVNGSRHDLTIEPRTILLDALREPLRLPGTKKGCDHGQCGACTVLINGRRVLSCLTLAVMHEGDEITTIEGLEQNGQLHPMQQAFMDCDGFQCGGCTSGQIMSAVAVLQEPVGSDDASVREAMSGNICRCGAYQGICQAIQSVRQASSGHANL